MVPRSIQSIESVYRPRTPWIKGRMVSLEGGSARVTKIYTSDLSPTLPQGTYGCFPEWLCTGGEEIISLSRDSQTLVLNWSKMSLGSMSQTRDHGGQVINGLLAQVWLIVSPVFAQIHPGAVFPVLECTAGTERLSGRQNPHLLIPSRWGLGWATYELGGLRHSVHTILGPGIQLLTWQMLFFQYMIAKSTGSSFLSSGKVSNKLYPHCPSSGASQLFRSTLWFSPQEFWLPSFPLKTSCWLIIDIEMISPSEQDFKLL